MHSNPSSCSKAECSLAYAPGFGELGTSEIVKLPMFSVDLLSIVDRTKPETIAIIHVHLIFLS
jgi:hypothetical protein